MRYYDSKLFIVEVGKRIKILRKKLNLTQFDLAVRADLEENAIQRIETGRVNSTLKTLLKISNALDVEFYELFYFSLDE